IPFAHLHLSKGFYRELPLSQTPVAVPSAELDEATRDFYLRALDILDATGIRYAVGGAYAMAAHAGIIRHTKDLDIFIRPDDLRRAFEVFRAHGYRVELTHPHWVGKIYDRPAG